MNHESNDLVELGSVSIDTAGGIELGVEPGGKEFVTGLRQD